MLNCKTTRSRFSLAEYWLNKIEDNYTNDDDIIESFVEYFLIICRSVEDYLINDFLDSVKPEILMEERSNIIYNKRKYQEDKKILNNKESQKIIDFLVIHNTEIGKFSQNLIVIYFRTLRNWTVHTIFPHIFENKHENKGTILERHFQRNFVNYLGLEQEVHLLLENGYSLTLENSDKESIFDIPPLSRLKRSEKLILKNELESKEAKSLLREYFQLIEQLIQRFEK